MRQALLALALAAPAMAPAQDKAPAAPAAPAAPRVSDEVLAGQLAHCAGVLALVVNSPRRSGVTIAYEDARAMLRLTILSVHALLGNDKGLQLVKDSQAQFESKLRLTREQQIGRMIDGETKQCTSIVEEHKTYLTPRILNAPGAR